jgi:undecaprenyl-diphosphatase
MSLVDVIVLAVLQGLTELLPVSSSAHVIVAEKLMGLDPSSPPMTLLLAMLHTRTMFAVIAYFWHRWRDTYFQSFAAFKKFAGLLLLATVLTGVVGEAIIKIIEKTVLRGAPHAEIEELFSHLELIAPALAAAGVLILIADILEKRNPPRSHRIPAPSSDRDAFTFAISISCFRGIECTHVHNTCGTDPVS